MFNASSSRRARAQRDASAPIAISLANTARIAVSFVLSYMGRIKPSEEELASSAPLPAAQREHLTAAPCVARSRPADLAGSLGHPAVSL